MHMYFTWGPKTQFKIVAIATQQDYLFAANSFPVTAVAI